MITLVQSAVGGSVSGSGVATPGYPFSLTTSAVGFGSPTTPGNFLVCVVWADLSWNNYPIGFTGTSVPSTPGFTWLTPCEAGVGSVAALYNRWVWIFCIPNAASMTSATTFTMGVNTGGTSTNVTIALEFSLYEFSGIDTSAGALPPSYVAGIDVAGAGHDGTGSATSPQTNATYPLGVPALGYLPTTTTDLVIVAVAAAPGGSLGPGSGYVSGISASVAVTGETQYQLNAAPGSVSTAFGGTVINWACAAVAFKGASPVAVTGVSPPSGPVAGGTAVTITGTDFLFGATVSFGGAAATSVVVVSSTTITCVTPAHAAGYVTVSVTDSDGTGSLANAFLYITPPVVTVTNVIPPFGPTTGGTAVTVFGTNFTLGSTVDFGGAAGTSVVVLYSTALTCVTPAHAAGAVTVSVTDIYGTGSLPNGFTYTSGTGGGGTPVGFTPKYPPIKKQPFTLWGLEAKRADSITADGVKASVLDRMDVVTTLTFPMVALSDMAAWKAFEQYALTGGFFTYRPILDYPNTSLVEPMFEYPGTDSGDDMGGYSVVQVISMDWTPKFESPGIFSLELKLRLVADVHPAS